MLKLSIRRLRLMKEWGDLGVFRGRQSPITDHRPSRVARGIFCFSHSSGSGSGTNLTNTCDRGCDCDCDHYTGTPTSKKSPAVANLIFIPDVTSSRKRPCTSKKINRHFFTIFGLYSYSFLTCSTVKRNQIPRTFRSILQISYVSKWGAEKPSPKITSGVQRIVSNNNIYTDAFPRIV